MTPAKINLKIYQGATFRKQFQYKTGNPATPVDLTGCSIRMHVRLKITSSTTIIELTTEDDRIVFVDEEEGIFQLILSAEETEDLDFTRAVYDIEIVFPNEDVIRVINGAVELSKEVTRQEDPIVGP